MSDPISSKELIARAGITYRQLDYWTRRGALVPLSESSPGSGCPRAWDPHEVRVARLLNVVGPGGWADDVARVAGLVRAGARGKVELVPGVMLDLDVVCYPEVRCVDAV